MFSKARVINTLGNRAVHSHRAVPESDALAALRELFHVAHWFARTYARAGRPAPGFVFDPAALPRPAATEQQTAEQLRTLEEGLRERDEKLGTLLADKGTLDEELKRLRAEVAKAKKEAAAQPDTHDYSEAETRDYFIDLLLKEAGWPLDQDRDREFEVSGMPNAEGKGFVDYVLWGDDGKPLGLVEAKRTRRDARVGQQQAKLYADCLERQFGQRPIIFYSNGLRALDVGQHPLPAATGAGLLQEGGAGAVDPAAGRRGARSRRPQSVRRLSSATTKPAPSAASPRPSSETTTARRCS